MSCQVVGSAGHAGPSRLGFSWKSGLDRAGRKYIRPLKYKSMSDRQTKSGRMKKLFSLLILEGRIVDYEFKTQMWIECKYDP